MVLLLGLPCLALLRMAAITIWWSLCLAAGALGFLEIGAFAVQISRLGRAMRALRELKLSHIGDCLEHEQACCFQALL